MNHGRKDCAGGNGDATAVYTGQLAGPASGNSGGGADLLCMVNDPIYDGGSTAYGGAGGLYATKFVTSTTAISSAYTSVNGFNVPCTVCQAPAARPYAMVNPGRQDCPTGFVRDFKGYLMAAAYNTNPNSYVCVNDAPQTLGVSQSTTSSEIYFLEPQFPVPGGYTAYYEISCAQCSASNGGGSVFVSYGTTTCPVNTAPVYEQARVAAGHYTHGGSGMVAVGM